MATRVTRSNASSSNGRQQNRDDEFYEVERIIKKRRHRSRGLEYFVKWRNFPTSDNTWEPASNFPPNLIEHFEYKRKRKVNESNAQRAPKDRTRASKDRTSASKDRTRESKDRAKKMSNSARGHKMPVTEEIMFEPQLIEKPIIVTDVTLEDQTVTICECEKPDGFFGSIE